MSKPWCQKSAWIGRQKPAKNLAPQKSFIDKNFLRFNIKLTK